MSDSSFGLYEKFSGFKEYVKERRTGLAQIIEETIESSGQIVLDRYQQLKGKSIDLLIKKYKVKEY